MIVVFEVFNPLGSLTRKKTAAPRTPEQIIANIESFISEVEVSTLKASFKAALTERRPKDIFPLHEDMLRRLVGNYLDYEMLLNTPVEGITTEQAAFEGIRPNCPGLYQRLVGTERTIQEQRQTDEAQQQLNRLGLMKQDLMKKDDYRLGVELSRIFSGSFGLVTSAANFIALYGTRAVTERQTGLGHLNPSLQELLAATNSVPGLRLPAIGVSDYLMNLRVLYSSAIPNQDPLIMRAVKTFNHPHAELKMLAAFSDVHDELLNKDAYQVLVNSSIRFAII